MWLHPVIMLKRKDSAKNSAGDVLPLDWGDLLDNETEATKQSQPEIPAFACDSIYDAFAYFLRVEVANGSATQDTVEAYHREVNNWIKWCELHRFAPEDAQHYHLDAFHEEMKRRGMSIATRAHKLTIIRRFYQSGIHVGLREDNPVSEVWAGKDLTSPEERFKVFSEEALTALVASLPNEGISGLRDRLMVALMAAHGLRRVEIHRLNHSDVQSGGVQSGGSEKDPASIIADGKGHKTRRVFLRDDTWNTMMAYFTEKEKAGYDLQGAVFVGHGNNGRGQRLSRVSINAVVDKYLSAAHLKSAGVSSHALRHTFGTLAVANGGRIENLRDTMGHGLLETTAIYAKAVEKAKNNPAYLIDVEI